MLAVLALDFIFQNTDEGTIELYFWEVDAPTWLWLLAVFVAGHRRRCGAVVSAAPVLIAVRRTPPPFAEPAALITCQPSVEGLDAEPG